MARRAFENVDGVQANENRAGREFNRLKRGDNDKWVLRDGGLADLFTTVRHQHSKFAEVMDMVTSNAANQSCTYTLKCLSKLLM